MSSNLYLSTCCSLHQPRLQAPGELGNFGQAWNPYPDNPVAFSKLQLKELKNGRLAMLAIMGKLANVYVTHDGLQRPPPGALLAYYVLRRPSMYPWVGAGLIPFQLCRCEHLNIDVGLSFVFHHCCGVLRFQELTFVVMIFVAACVRC